MNFSPLDIYNKSFKKKILGGYKPDQVDQFLDEVGISVEKLLKEYNHLKKENENLLQQLENYEKIEDKLGDTLIRVQEVADERTKQAEKESKLILQEARMKAEKIMKEAQQDILEERDKIEKLREARELFEIRFRNLLKGYLKLLDKKRLNQIDEIAVSVESDEQESEEDIVENNEQVEDSQENEQIGDNNDTENNEEKQTNNDNEKNEEKAENH